MSSANMSKEPVPVGHFKESMWFSAPSTCFTLVEKRGCFLELQTRSCDMKKENVVKFILETNMAEDIGTQDIGDTEEAINNAKTNQTTESKETLGIYNGLLYLFKLEKEIVRFLTPGIIEELHKVTTKEAQPNKAGKVRSSVADAVRVKRSNNSEHYYLSGEWVQNALLALCDLYNTELVSIMESKGDGFPRLISLAGWFLFHFLNIHPFFDGNGRIGRLLVAYILRVKLPERLVPLKDRDTYLKTLETAHKEDDSETYYPLEHIEYVTNCVKEYLRSSLRMQGGAIVLSPSMAIEDISKRLQERCAWGAGGVPQGLTEKVYKRIQENSEEMRQVMSDETTSPPTQIQVYIVKRLPQ